MKAVILASGEGKRLRPLTNELPKPLLRIDTDTILDHQIINLMECGVKDIVITTGPFENAVKKHMEESYPSVNVSYVHNSRYDTTNYIYSMWLTKKLIDSDIILLHGDLLFEKKLLEKMINRKENSVLVNKKMKLPEKDFKAIIENDRVVKIGVDFFGKNTFACFPMYKFSKDGFLLWLNVCEKYIEKGEVNIYAETAFNSVEKIPLYPLYFNNEFCMEIDTKEDMKIAKNMIKKKKGNLDNSAI